MRETKSCESVREGKQQAEGERESEIKGRTFPVRGRANKGSGAGEAGTLGVSVVSWLT